MVDSMANSAEDYLIESFQFKIPPGASYVTDRRTVSYFTAGSNIYTSNGGTTVIRKKLDWGLLAGPWKHQTTLYFN